MAIESEVTNKAARTAIKKIAGTYNKTIVDVLFATVTKVDKTTRTCTVTPLSGRSDTEIDSVCLMPDNNDGELKIPSIGSTVGVALSTEVDAFIFAWSDLDEWLLTIGNTTIDVVNGKTTFNKGLLGGLVNIQVLEVALNELQTEINTLKATLQSNLTVMGIALAAVDGGVTTTQATILTATQLPQIDISQIEDTKILH